MNGEMMMNDGTTLGSSLVAFSLSSLSMLLTIGLLIFFIKLKKFLAILIFYFFSWIGVEYYQILFLPQLIWSFYFFFTPIMWWVDYNDCFSDIELSLYPWDKPHVTLYVIIFMDCWNLFDNVLLEAFASILRRDIGP